MSNTSGPDHLDVDPDKFLQSAEEQATDGLNMMANPAIGNLYNAMIEDFNQASGIEPDPNAPAPSQRLAARFQRDRDAAHQERQNQQTPPSE